MIFVAIPLFQSRSVVDLMRLLHKLRLLVITNISGKLPNLLQITDTNSLEARNAAAGDEPARVRTVEVPGVRIAGT